LASLLIRSLWCLAKQQGRRENQQVQPWSRRLLELEAASRKRWRELHGAHSWNGLLDPLDLDLRRNIIHYGEFAQATYDGFNTERRSPHVGACMYGADELLHISGAGNAAHYEVTKFIYSTSTLPLPAAFLLLPLAALKDVWSRESNFIGYVAVATDEGAAALGGATSSSRGVGRSGPSSGPKTWTSC
jgi:hypothetical protein